MKAKYGIWVDKRIAKLVSIDGGTENFQTIDSNIEEFHPKGGSGSRFKGGPQDVVQDSKYLEREKHQHKEFFKNIAEKVKDAESLVIFGPAQTGEKLYSALFDSHPEIYNKAKCLAKADSMTDNQIKAWVKTYFSE